MAVARSQTLLPYSLMISKNPTAALAAMAALSLVWSCSALAADTNSSAAIEAVTKNDSMLRSALGSLERSEQQLREKFGKELATLNEARLKALQQAFDRASSRRDTESVTNLASLINTMKDKASAESLGAKPDDVSPVGNWEFVYKGQPRRFRLAENNSFQGQYAVSGKAFTGTWERSNNGIVLKRPGEEEDVFATISMSDSKDAKLRQFNGHAMSGRQTD
jgi:hypothetical protein